MKPSESNNQIFIRGLKVTCHIGVPDEERAESQELLLNITMAPKVTAEDIPLNDNISRTIDYHAVAIRAEEISLHHPRKLIETLSEDIAHAILDEFAVAAVTVEIEKFILPNTRCVGVVTTRSSPSRTVG